MVLLSQHGSEIGMVMESPCYTAGEIEGVLAECCVGMIYMLKNVAKAWKQEACEAAVRRTGETAGQRRNHSTLDLHSNTQRGNSNKATVPL